ncbi:MAG TPA: hypothetical protein VJ044_00955, partial [Candidatus Hodarchaeales archaeon]|nr:hypothetical protein [Candidatus Hodarchaeales archaeon]
MTFLANISEPYEEACDVLVNMFDRLNKLDLSPNDRDVFRRYLLADLVTKSNNGPLDYFRNVWTRVSSATMPEAVKRRLDPAFSPESDKMRADEPVTPATMEKLSGKGQRQVSKKIADVVIVTVIPQEFEAALKAFGVPKARIDFPYREGKYFRVNLGRQNNSDIVVYITMIGEPRNLPCANVCRDIFEIFELKKLGACILVGISGGNKQKVKLGDVVGSHQLFDIEGGKSELVKGKEKFQPRIEVYRPKKLRRLIRG